MFKFSTSGHYLRREPLCTSPPAQHGQGLAEYALLLSLVAVAVILVLSVLGRALSNTFQNIQCQLSNDGANCECAYSEQVVLSEPVCAGNTFSYKALTSCGSETSLTLVVPTGDSLSLSYNPSTNVFETTVEDADLCMAVTNGSFSNAQLISTRPEDAGVAEFNVSLTDTIDNTNTPLEVADGGSSGGDSGGSSGGSSGGDSGGSSGGSSGGDSGGSSGGSSGGDSGGSSGGSSGGDSGGSSGGSDGGSFGGGGSDNTPVPPTAVPNQAPTLLTIGNQTIDEADSRTLSISGMDPDNDTLTFSAQNLPAFMQLTPVNDTSADLVIAPSSDQSGVYSNIIITVSDGELTDSKTFQVTVNDVVPTIAFITSNTGNPPASDDAFIAHLEDEGYEVVKYAASTNANTVTANADLIFISESVNSGDVGTKFNSTTLPVITNETALYDDLQIANSVNTTSARNITITNEGHDLAGGLDESVRIYASNNDIAYGTPSDDAIVIAHIGNNTGRKAIFAYETGDLLMNDQPASGKRVGMFAYEGNQLNTNGWTLFDAAIEWALE